MHERAEHTVTRHQRVVEMITSLAGRPVALYLLLVSAVFWVVINEVLYRTGIPPLDAPPFNGMQEGMTLLALLLTMLIVATQRRQATLAEQRAHLDLQVNLLAEQKIAKLIALLEELRHDLPAVRDREDREAQAMAHPADPHAVAEALTGTLDGADDERG